MSNKKYKNRRAKSMGTKALRMRMRKVYLAKQARLQLQLGNQEEQDIGPKLNINQDQSINNLVGYNLGCCPSTSRFLEAYLCSKCLLWFHLSCISQLTIKDKEAIRNNQWVCYDCKEQVLVDQNEDELDKKLFTEIEPQNKEKLMALKLIDDLKSMNKAIEIKLEEISKWVENKFGAGADTYLPEEIETGDKQEYEYSSLLKEQCQSLSRIPVIELNRISLVGIGDEKSDSTMENRSFKIKERSHLEKHKKVKERGSLPMKSILQKLKTRARKDSNKSNSSKNNLQPMLFKCPRENCEKKFESKYNMKTHINYIHDKIKNMVCHFCGKKMGTKRELRNHIKYVHEKVKRPDQKVICHYCGKSIAGNDSRLRQHIKRIHGLGFERFECPEENCSKSFTTKRDLDKHTKIVHREPAEYLKCTEEGCLKRFKNKRYLKYHLEIHAAKGVRNFACLMCDKTFMTRNCLAAHKRMSHAKEVNHEFKCTFEGCHLGYSYRKYLEDHLKTHDPNYQPPAKQKLIICQFCAKEYETFPQLNRHILNVHEK